MSFDTPTRIGAPLHRREDQALITGRGAYVDDLRPEGLLHAAFVRSPEPHGLIESIDLDEASAMPGVVGVYTAADLGLEHQMPNAHPDPRIADAVMPPALATHEVCYAGQTVAVVVATDRYLAADAAEAVWVDYEPLPAIADVRKACEEAAIRVHRDRASNVATTMQASWGATDDVFARAELIVPIELAQHRGACMAMEPRGVLADVIDDRLTVWSSTQSISLLRKLLCAHLDEDDIRVIAPDVGGGFGPKGSIYSEEYVIAALARHLRRPVKWIESRREHLLSTNQQRDLIARLEVAAESTGKILGLRGTLLHDNGAYMPYGLLLPATGMDLIQGPYTLEALDIEIEVVYTNAVPTSPIRGAMRPNAAFLIERVLDAVADRLDLDPFEVRRRNFIPSDSFPYEFAGEARYGGKITYDSGDYAASLEAVTALADVAGFDERRADSLRRGRFRGMGVAAYVEDTGLGPFEAARVELDDDGVVHVSVKASSQGQGHATVFAQIASTELAVDAADVIVHIGDSDLPGTGVSTVASRTAVTAGASTRLASTALADRLRSQAAEHFEASPADIVLEGGVARVAGSPVSELTFAELAAEAGSPLVADAEHPTPRPTYAFGCQIAEVEIDPDTGFVEVQRYSVAHDCGTILNPMIVDGQIDGGVVHGLSNALLERVVYDDNGQPRTTTLMDLRIPTAMDVPRIEKTHTITPAPDNPLGAKGAGEGGTIPVAAVIASAVDNALSDLGVFVDRYPLTPEVVRAMIQEARGEQG